MMCMLPSVSYTVAASGGSPTPEELATADPAQADADRAIAESTFHGGIPIPDHLVPLLDAPVLYFHSPVQVD